MTILEALLPTLGFAAAGGWLCTYLWWKNSRGWEKLAKDALAELDQMHTLANKMLAKIKELVGN